MITKKRVLSIVLSILMSITFVSCSTVYKKAELVDITDATGTVISFDKPPEKIISLLPASTEILFALGLGDKIIAVSEYCDYPKEAKQKKTLKTGEYANIEELISLKPDVIFMGKMAQTEEMVNQLRQSGFKVVILYASTIDETYDDIRLIGKVTKSDAKAEEIINSMKISFDEIKNAVKNETPKKVYIEISPLEFGLWTCGKKTFHQELFDICNITNIFADLEGWQEISEEQVIAKNPDIILTTCATYMQNGLSAAQEIMQRKNWQGITAVINKDVYEVDESIMTHPAPRLVDAARELVKIVYEKDI